MDDQPFWEIQEFGTPGCLAREVGPKGCYPASHPRIKLHLIVPDAATLSAAALEHDATISAPLLDSTRGVEMKISRRHHSA